MLLIDNQAVKACLTMEMTLAALERSYLDLAAGNGVCRPRVDINIPTDDPAKIYRWGTMEGGAIGGYFAIRMKSDIIHYETNPDGSRRQEKYCGKPGQFCGLIFLTDIQTGLPLALINDGELQHMRVGADGGLGVKLMARPDAEVVGMLGSGGMADAHMTAFMAVRPSIRRLQIYSPNRANREAFAARMAERHGIEAVACESADEIYRGADIVAALTNATRPVLDGNLIEPGTHIVNIGAGGRLDPASLEKVDIYLRFGDTPPPTGFDKGFEDEYLSWRAGPNRSGREEKRAHGAILPEKRISFGDVASGKAGRTSDSQITWSERGNLQGAQFHAVAGVTYEAAKAAGLGRELPDEWFLQDIRN